MSMAIVHEERVSDMVEVVTIDVTDHVGRVRRQSEVRCAGCPIVEIWEHFHHAVVNAPRHVCEVES